ncbi:MAG: zinc ribbon domain-containing protein, partial [Lachnospiraceae bacterium]|nr:zinc ribbon domain-containing protein [Lachnospiraceae bacterium]
MLCSQCGKLIREDSVYCPYCGAGLPEEGSAGRAAQEGRLLEERTVDEKLPEFEPAASEPQVGRKASKPEDMPEFEMTIPEPQAGREAGETEDMPEFEPAMSEERQGTETEESEKSESAEKNGEKRRKKRVLLAGLSGAAVLVVLALLAVYLLPGGKEKWKLYGKNVIFGVGVDDEVRLVSAADGRVLESPESSCVGGTTGDGDGGIREIRKRGEERRKA